MERAASDEAAASLVVSTHIFRGPEEIPEYLEESQMQTLSGESRAFVIWNPKEIPDLPSGERDVLIVLTSSKKKFSDARAKRVYNFQKFKTYDDNNEVESWILQEGERHNIDLRRVVRALFVNSGNSLRKISSEIKKLSVLTPPGAETTPESARSVMVFSAELTPRNVIDSICDGNAARALAYYDKLQENGDETGWIIAYLQRHVLQQLRLEAAVRMHVSESRGAELIGVHPFIYKKMTQSRIGLWSDESLIVSIGTLTDLDIAHKRGDTLVEFGLELEIIRLCEEIKNDQRCRH